VSELWDVGTRIFPELAAGFFLTLRLVAAAFVLAMFVGILVAALRVAPVRPLRWLGAIYVESFRNIPLLVLIIIFGAGLRRAGLPIDRFPAAVFALGLYTAAYIAEAVRSGVFAVGKGQIEASLSLGLTYRRTLSKVVLPQAVRTVIPPIGNLVIAMIKNSAIAGASLLGLNELLHAARVVQGEVGKTTPTFFWAAVGFLLLTIPTTAAVRYLERRLAVRR
jgi:His/Glu/Gln/Arg/opine family amino acid ABC transporter permease subunit